MGTYNNAGRQLLKEKPMVNTSTVDMNYLSRLDANTFGRKYYEWMNHDNGFSPDDRTNVRFITDPDLAYIMTRYRQTHDFLHVITDLDVTILGELGLKWFEYYYTGFSFCLLSGIAGQVKVPAHQRRFLNCHILPWARRSASKSKDLISFRYENFFEHSIEDVRRMVNVEPAPKYERDAKSSRVDC